LVAVAKLQRDDACYAAVERYRDDVVDQLKELPVFSVRHRTDQAVGESADIPMADEGRWFRRG
jgi:hypothetical protein